MNCRTETTTARTTAWVATCVALAVAVVVSLSGPLWAELQTSGRLETQRSHLRRAQFGNDFRYVLQSPPRRYGVSVRSNTSLRFAYANTAQAWRGHMHEIELQITLHTLNGEHLVLFRIRHAIEQEPTWHELIAPLATAAGRSGALELSAKTADTHTPVPELIYWSNPILEPVPAVDRPNIVLVSIDTLRADHLGCFGYARDTSPHIDRLAREGVLFRQAIASSNWTLPSHASMLTGLHPARHRAVSFAFAPLRQDVDTLAELLWDVGYETGAFTGGGFVSFGFDQGFDRYWMPAPGTAKAESITETLARSKQWMAVHPYVPFFLFLHTYAVHLPYAPPPPFNLLFDPDYGGPFRDSFSMKDNVRVGKHPDAATRQRLIALYDGELRHFDTQLGELLNYVRNSGFGDRTCVAVTSDHGEEFNEHGEMFHRRARLYDELLRVPLIVWCPARYAGGQVIDDPVSLVDVTPTILDIAGAPLPKDSDGRSLEPTLMGTPLSPRLTVSEVDGSLEARAGTVRAIRSAQHKLIESSLDGTRAVFDLASDPGETTNVAEREPQITTELAAQVAPLPSPAPAPAPDEESRRDAVVIERLRALGYFQ